MTSPGMRVDRVSRSLIATLYLGLAALLLVGCGSSAGGNPNAAPSSVSQLIQLHYVASASGQRRTYNAELGSLITVKVTSDVAGVVSIPAYSTSEVVKKGGTAVLVFSADNPGSYAVEMRVGTTRTTFAVLKIPNS